MAEIKLTSFVEDCLVPKEGWKVQSFKYYAAHFLVGAGLLHGDMDANVRGLAAAMQKQYDIGVEHGAHVAPGYATPAVASPDAPQMSKSDQH